MNNSYPSSPSSPSSSPRSICFRCGRPLLSISLIDGKPYPPRPKAIVNEDDSSHSTIISGLVYDEVEKDGTVASVHLECYMSAHGELPSICNAKMNEQLDKGIMA